ncbi:MAG: hypothetical protein SFV52_02330 [Saprospiraceae bacterium]|nr:hypothetical protein [Saprospiraceae bacterium]
MAIVKGLDWSFKAMNPNTPIEELDEMAAKSSEWAAISDLVKNPNLPFYILESFLQNKDFGVRKLSASHPNMPFHILKGFIGEDYQNPEIYTN